MTSLHPMDHTRTNELLFRIAVTLWSRIGDRPEVLQRRQALSPHAAQFRCSAREASRFESDVEPICDWASGRWCELYDQYVGSPTTYVFADGFAVLFFARILYANNVVLLRGQYDAAWSLTTSRERAEANGTLDRRLKHTERFIDALERSDVIRRCYHGSSVPDNHRAAILQHYGFPTDLLDFSYSYDVALYFAEGGVDHLPVSTSPAENGSLYVVPSPELNNSVLTSLPAAIMRPSLQRGVFVAATPGARQRLQTFKYTFRHHDMPVWNGLGEIHVGSAVGLGRYLFPASDPVLHLANAAAKT